MSLIPSARKGVLHNPCTSIEVDYSEIPLQERTSIRSFADRTAKKPRLSSSSQISTPAPILPLVLPPIFTSQSRSAQLLREYLNALEVVSDKSIFNITHCWLNDGLLDDDGSYFDHEEFFQEWRRRLQENDQTLLSLDIQINSRLNPFNQLASLKL
jgi:hypothetical protein